MTKTSKATAAKIPASEVTEGMTIKGNLISGAHVVTEIRVDAASIRGGGSARTLLFVNEQGREFFVGRTYAKATVAA